MIGVKYTKKEKEVAEVKKPDWGKDVERKKDTTVSACKDCRCNKECTYWDRKECPEYRLMAYNVDVRENVITGPYTDGGLFGSVTDLDQGTSERIVYSHDLLGGKLVDVKNILNWEYIEENDNHKEDDNYKKDNEYIKIDYKESKKRKKLEEQADAILARLEEKEERRKIVKAGWLKNKREEADMVRYVCSMEMDKCTSASISMTTKKGKEVFEDTYITEEYDDAGNLVIETDIQYYDIHELRDAGINEYITPEPRKGDCSKDKYWNIVRFTNRRKLKLFRYFV